MSQENGEIVRSIHAEWARGNFSSTTWADPEIELVRADDFLSETPFQHGF
jgi:hypothetical protein